MWQDRPLTSGFAPDTFLTHSSFQDQISVVYQI